MTRLNLAVLLALASTLAVNAHEAPPKHGGVIASTDHHHLEVVVGDGTIAVYVGHHDGSAESVAGAKATAVVLSGGQKSDVTLAPEGDALKGTGSFKATKGTTVVLTLSVPDHETEQVRVTLDRE